MSDEGSRPAPSGNRRGADHPRATGARAASRDNRNQVAGQFRLPVDPRHGHCYRRRPRDLGLASTEAAREAAGHPFLGCRLGPRCHIALSNDGTWLAFIGGPRRQIFVRSMDQLPATPIANTEGAAFPSFSPDGQSISYIGGDPRSKERQLMKVAVAGGLAQKLANVSSRVAPPTQHWTRDDHILFVSEGALLRVSRRFPRLRACSGAARRPAVARDSPP